MLVKENNWVRDGAVKKWDLEERLLCLDSLSHSLCNFPSLAVSDTLRYTVDEDNTETSLSQELHRDCNVHDGHCCLSPRVARLLKN